MSVEQLVSRVFATRNCAHITHWSTGNGEEHRATGDLYEDLIETLDRFIEAYQGNFGKIGTVKFTTDCCDILDCVDEDLKWLDKNRDKVCEEICALENIYDELVAVYLTARYKLKFLK